MRLRTEMLDDVANDCCSELCRITELSVILNAPECGFTNNAHGTRF